MKPYACGVVIHPAIDAVRDLAVRRGLDRGPIEKIRLRVHPLVLELTGKTDPRTGLEGKFSVTFACSIALLDGPGGRGRVLRRRRRRARTSATLMARIEVVPDADRPAHPGRGDRAHRRR